MAKGTLITLDLLETQFADEAIVDIGLEGVYAGIVAGLSLHNAEKDQAMSFFAEVRNETRIGQYRHARYGENRILHGQKVDELGVVDVQKVKAGYTVGFPLDRIQYGVGWNDDYFELATGREFRANFDAIMQGDIIDEQNEIFKAIFNPDNRTEEEDFGDHIDVEVKALINADGANIPEGPTGETFNGGTHNHYMANAGWSNTVLHAVVDNVKEHYRSGQVYIFINKNNEADIKGLADMIDYLPANMVAGTASDHIRGVEVDLPLADKQIGEFDNCIVWMKPWMPEDYVLVVIVSPRIKKIVRFRRRKNGLYVKAENKSFPLTARWMENNYGVGIYERTAAAVCFFDGADYAVPAQYAW